MNAIRESMRNIQATEDLKNKTLQYLKLQHKAKGRLKPPSVLHYALAAVCLFLLLGAGGYSVYRQPVSYISIDVNPSVELGINRFGRVVHADAYNEDGQDVLQHLSLRNLPYMQAVSKLLADEADSGFLKEGSLLVFTVISGNRYSIMEELEAADFSQNYETLMYTGDTDCMREAHSHEMSFGRYRAYQELLQYDGSVTVEDCHNMTMEELHSRIEGCAGHHGGNGYQDGSGYQNGNGYHGDGHHDSQHR